MPQAVEFDRDALARWYARQHLQTDPGITEVWHLPTNAGAREIRFVEINSLLGSRNDNGLEPIDFGVDTGTESEHRLFVLDVTPDQWARIQSHKLSLPYGWSLTNALQLQ